jgi:hypothetical protein
MHYFISMFYPIGDKTLIKNSSTSFFKCKRFGRAMGAQSHTVLYVSKVKMKSAFFNSVLFFTGQTTFAEFYVDLPAQSYYKMAFQVR